MQNIFHIVIRSALLLAILLLAMLAANEILLPHSIGMPQGLYAKTKLASISKSLSFSCSDFYQTTHSYYGDSVVQQEKNAALHLWPSSGTFKVGDEFSVTVSLDSPDKAMNAAEAKVIFPSDTLEVSDIFTKNSLFSLWIQEPAFSNKDGMIMFIGGLFNPGFLGTQSFIMEIIFKVKREGYAELTIQDAKILANDGFGTSIFKESRGAVYTLISNRQTP